MTKWPYKYRGWVQVGDRVVRRRTPIGPGADNRKTIPLSEVAPGQVCGTVLRLSERPHPSGICLVRVRWDTGHEGYVESHMLIRVEKDE